MLAKSCVIRRNLSISHITTCTRSGPQSAAALTGVGVLVGSEERVLEHRLEGEAEEETAHRQVDLELLVQTQRLPVVVL